MFQNIRSLEINEDIAICIMHYALCSKTCAFLLRNLKRINTFIHIYITQLLLCFVLDLIKRDYAIEPLKASGMICVMRELGITRERRRVMRFAQL